MRFYVGQTVYVDFTTKAEPGTGKYMCSIGQIVAGPFDPDTRMSSRWWKVEIDGICFDVVEKILKPFDEPDREVDVERILETTE